MQKIIKNIPWLISLLFYCFEFIHRVSLNALMPAILLKFNISKSIASTLSISYFTVYAAMQIPMGIFIDKYGPRKILIYSATLLCIGSLIFAHSHSVLPANIARILISIGSSGAFVLCIKTAANIANKNNMATIVGTTNLLGMLGAIMGGSPLAILTNKISITQLFYLSAGISFIFVILICLFIKKHTLSHNNFGVNLPQLKTIWSRLDIWKITLIAVFIVPAITTYAELWGGIILIKKLSLSNELATYISSFAFVGIAIGGPSIGLMADKSQQKYAYLLAGICICFFALFSIYVLPVKILKNINLLCVLHFLIGFGASTMLLCFSIITLKTPKNLHASNISIANTIIMSGSACLQTICSFILALTQDLCLSVLLPLIIGQVMAIILTCNIIKLEK